MKRRRTNRSSIVGPEARRKPEPTIGLINIVFLMLIFFLVAGTLANPIPESVDGVESADSPPTAPPDALAVGADGALYHRGEPTDLATFATQTRLAGGGNAKPVRLFVDKAFPAKALVGLVADLRAKSFDRVVLIAERER